MGQGTRVSGSTAKWWARERRRHAAAKSQLRERRATAARDVCAMAMVGGGYWSQQDAAAGTEAGRRDPKP